MFCSYTWPYVGSPTLGYYYLSISPGNFVSLGFRTFRVFDPFLSGDCWGCYTVPNTSEWL